MKTLFQKFLLQFDEDVTVADVQTSGSNSEPKEGGTAVPSRPPLYWGLFRGHIFCKEFSTHLASRYRKVTICPRVQGVSGLKLLPPVPEVTPSFTAQATASA